MAISVNTKISNNQWGQNQNTSYIEVLESIDVWTGFPTFYENMQHNTDNTTITQEKIDNASNQLKEISKIENLSTDKLPYITFLQIKLYVLTLKQSALSKEDSSTLKQNLLLKFFQFIDQMNESKTSNPALWQFSYGRLKRKVEDLVIGNVVGYFALSNQSPSFLLLQKSILQEKQTLLNNPEDGFINVCDNEAQKLQNNLQMQYNVMQELFESGQIPLDDDALTLDSDLMQLQNEVIGFSKAQKQTTQKDLIKKLYEIDGNISDELLEHYSELKEQMQHFISKQQSILQANQDTKGSIKSHLDKV
jgi:hypothetical protein